MDITYTNEYKAAQVLENALNDYNWSPQRFADCISLYHKTLQQTLVRTIVAIIKKLGAEDYSFDSRNKASHQLCKGIIASGILDETCLPMI